MSFPLGSLWDGRGFSLRIFGILMREQRNQRQRFVFPECCFDNIGMRIPRLATSYLKERVK